MKQIATLLKRFKPTSLLAALCFLFAADVSRAQISITNLPYNPPTTDFNAYNPNSSANLTSTLPVGWTAASSASAAYQGRGTGTGTGGGYYGFGTGSEYSIGALRSGGTGNITYAVSYTNNTGSTITTINISFDYEQWRYANTSGWDCSGTGALAGNATLDAMDFTGSATGTNGTPTITPVASFTLSGLSIADNQSFGIQFVTTDGTGADNGVAIDNFSISATATALPINLLSFTANTSGRNAQLSWTTSCASTAKTFAVEHSADGQSFTEAGHVDATASECSNATRAYSFETPARTGLYRLAMHDASGRTSYSRALSVIAAEASAGSIRLYPSPAKGTLQVEGLQAGSACRILDATGRTMMAWTASGEAESVAVGTLPAGMYLLVADAAGSRVAQRFSKN